VSESGKNVPEKEEKKLNYLFLKILPKIKIRWLLLTSGHCCNELAFKILAFHLDYITCENVINYICFFAVYMCTKDFFLVFFLHLENMIVCVYVCVCMSVCVCDNVCVRLSVFEREINSWRNLLEKIDWIFINEKKKKKGVRNEHGLSLLLIHLR